MKEQLKFLAPLLAIPVVIVLVRSGANPGAHPEPGGAPAVAPTMPVKSTEADPTDARSQGQQLFELGRQQHIMEQKLDEANKELVEKIAPLVYIRCLERLTNTPKMDGKRIERHLRQRTPESLECINEYEATSFEDRVTQAHALADEIRQEESP